MYKPATALARSFQTSVVQILRIQVSESPLVHSVVMVRLDGQSVPSSSGESTTSQMPTSPSHSVACASGCE